MKGALGKSSNNDHRIALLSVAVGVLPSCTRFLIKLDKVFLNVFHIFILKRSNLSGFAVGYMAT